MAYVVVVANKISRFCRVCGRDQYIYVERVDGTDTTCCGTCQLVLERTPTPAPGCPPPEPTVEGYHRAITPRRLDLQDARNREESMLLATVEVALIPPPVLECDAVRREYHVKGGCCATCHTRAEGKFEETCWYHIQGRMRYVCCTVASSVGERRLPDEVADGRHLLLN